MESISVQVVGGSLGGLTAACLLRDAGHDVSVLERSSRELEERGAGIGLLPETARYLVERAGFDLAQVSVATDHIRYLARDGSILHEAEHRYRFSSWNTVYRALRTAYGSSPYSLGCELISVDQDDGGVVGRYADGTSRRSDLLVGADGVGSVVRSQLLPTTERSYAGYVAWRGMVAESDLDPAMAARLGDAITYHVSANSHILVYPIPNQVGSVVPGDRLVNFVWYRNYLGGGDLDDLMTDREGAVRDLSVPPGLVADHHVSEARATAAARLPSLLAELVAAVELPFIQTIYDIEVERMAFGRVCLLGDSAFAVRPHAAAGTAKAADDGWALVDALVEHPDFGAALAVWERRQLSVGRRLLDRTRAIGARSQVHNDWEPGDPSLIFGLHGPGG